jgi:ABC-type nitrate/sulfonate/bicarbonate transport system substrate-binding protein
MEDCIRMLRRVLLGNLIAFTLFVGSAGTAAPATKVVIAYSVLNERGTGALLVARDQGFFRKYDLDVNLILMRSGAVALSALSSGEAQFYSGSANGS